MCSGVKQGVISRQGIHITLPDLPFMAKTAMKKAKPDVTIAQEEGGKRWKMKFVSLMTQEISFELGKEFMNKVPLNF